MHEPIPYSDIAGEMADYVEFWEEEKEAFERALSPRDIRILL